MRKILLLAITFLLLSCDNSKNQNKLEEEIRNKQNTIDLQQIQIIQLEERINRLENNTSNNSNDNYAPNENQNNANYFGQYYFIVLEVIEDHVFEKENFYYTTQVNQLSNYNENVKYRLLDEVVTEYKRSPSGIAYKGNVKKRNIYLFDTYEQASKAREKYIMN